VDETEFSERNDKLPVVSSLHRGGALRADAAASRVKLVRRLDVQCLTHVQETATKS
jgi:hypothetical protein